MRDSENLFMIGATVVIAIALVAIPSCTYYSNVKDNQAVVDLVKAGADPIAAKCAIRSGQTDCALAAAGRGIK